MFFNMKLNTTKSRTHTHGNTAVVDLALDVTTKLCIRDREQTMRYTMSCIGGRSL